MDQAGKVSLKKSSGSTAPLKLSDVHPKYLNPTTTGDHYPYDDDPSIILKAVETVPTDQELATPPIQPQEKYSSDYRDGNANKSSSSDIYAAMHRQQQSGQKNLTRSDSSPGPSTTKLGGFYGSRKQRPSLPDFMLVEDREHQMNIYVNLEGLTDSKHDVRPASADKARSDTISNLTTSAPPEQGSDPPDLCQPNQLQRNAQRRFSGENSLNKVGNSRTCTSEGAKRVFDLKRASDGHQNVGHTPFSKAPQSSKLTGTSSNPRLQNSMMNITKHARTVTNNGMNWKKLDAQTANTMDFKNEARMNNITLIKPLPPFGSSMPSSLNPVVGAMATSANRNQTSDRPPQ